MAILLGDDGAQPLRGAHAVAPPARALFGPVYEPPEGARPGEQLTLTDPAHVPLDAAVAVHFSEAMDSQSVQRGFRLLPPSPGSLGWADPTTLVFRPSLPLRPGTTYEVLVRGVSVKGAPLLAEPDPSFTTVSPPHLALPFTLTFDDCASPAAIGAIVAALHDRGLHAIFFPTGACRDANPWLIPTLLAAGHRVCNHTYSHPYLPGLSDTAIRSEIARGVTAGGCNLFRPPYGAVDARVAGIAASMGYRVQLWDVDTRDWAGTSAADMVAMIRAHGGVILMHMQGPHTAEAILAL